MRRDQKVTIRLTAEEYRIIQTESIRRNQAVSEFIRSILTEREIPPVIDHSREIMAHVCRLYSIINPWNISEADIVRKELDELCRCLSR